MLPAFGEQRELLPFRQPQLRAQSVMTIDASCFAMYLSCP